jgi:hypothetical protein
VSGLSFVCSLGLGARLGAVRATPLSQAWDLIDVCGSAARDVLKSLGALDAALCRLLGLAPPRSYYVSELDRSLRVRRAYALFQRALLELAGSGEPRARLRSGANLIARLIGRDDYPHFRVHDRQMLRALQGRIRSWLVRSSGPEPLDAAATLAGERLWQDLLTFAALLQLVNHRAELWEHDRGAILAAAAAIQAHDLTPDQLASIVEPLRFLQGRDPGLDELLLAPSPPPLEAWRATLDRCRTRLEPG